MRKGAPAHWRARAVATVEAAVTFPLVVLVFLLVVQGALYVHARDVVLGAAREGAHTAAMEHDTVDAALSDGQSRAQAILVAGLGRYARDVQVLPAEDDGGNVVVEVAGSFPLLLPGPGQGGRLTVPLVARARAAREVFRPQGEGGY
jgi:Flp pilus assembly protein TadG